jgi:Flp pilus assembly protein TadD, contains TPR repeats
MKKALLLILLLLLVSGVVSSAAEANAGNSTVVTLDSEAEAIDLLNEGTRYAQANDYYNALEAYSNAIELNPGFAKAYFNRGLLLASRKRTRDRAIRDFNQAIELAPDFAEAYVGRGNVHDSYKARRRHLAIEDYAKAVEINPAYAIAYYNLANCYDLNNDKDNAVDAYKQFLQYADKVNHANQIRIAEERIPILSKKYF